MNPRVPILILGSLLLSSCDNTLYLSKGTLTKDSHYEIKKVYSCCGCSASYYNIYEKKRLLEQVVFNYNCPPSNLPTKFVYKYQKGKIISAQQYVAVRDSTYTMPVTEQEKQIHSSLAAVDTSKALPLSEVKGFRKPNGNEKRHGFPFIKKGYKLPIQ